MTATAQEFFELYCVLECLREDEKILLKRQRFLRGTIKAQWKLIGVIATPKSNYYHHNQYPNQSVNASKYLENINNIGELYSQRTDEAVEDIQNNIKWMTEGLEWRKTQPKKHLKWYQVIKKYNHEQNKQEEDKLKEDLRLLNLLISKYKAGDLIAVYAEAKTLSEKRDQTRRRIREMSERLHEICEHAPSHPIIEQKAGEMK